jgi:hypothetical protein
MPLKQLPELEWTAGRSRTAWRIVLAVVLLAAGVIVVLHWKHGFDARRGEQERRLERAAQLAARRGEHRPEPAAQLSPAGARQVNTQIALLNRDWTGLLEQLAPRSRQVKLLGMDVNPATGAVRITGGADSAADANAYAEWLQGHGALLRDVRLMLLERKAAHIHFEVTAQWAE